jgi:pimeloyl-ACP methyl ester carboxylesterase
MNNSTSCRHLPASLCPATPLCRASQGRRSCNPTSRLRRSGTPLCRARNRCACRLRTRFAKRWWILGRSAWSVRCQRLWRNRLRPAVQPSEYPHRSARLFCGHRRRHLAALIEKLQLGKVHVIGHSYGALTALFLAVKHPELVRTLVLARLPRRGCSSAGKNPTAFSL